MITREKFERALKVIADYKEQSKSEIIKLKKDLEDIENAKVPKIDVNETIYDIEISVRLFNVLIPYFRLELGVTDYHLIKVANLADVSLKTFKSYRNVGDACIKEFMTILLQSGIQPKP